MKSMKDVVEVLKGLGVTEYEARVYTALLSLGPATAVEASSASGVPYSKIYIVLSRLEKRGWVEAQGKRPVRYLARPPSEALEILVSEEGKRLRRLADEAAGLLESIYKRGTEMRKPDVWVIRGAASVIGKAVEMMGRAEAEILISLPYLPERAEESLSLLSLLAARGVSVRILLTRGIRLKLSGVEIRRRERLFGGGVIVDGREVLLILGQQNDVIGIWSNEPGLARFAEEYFNYLWKGAEMLCRRSSGRQGRFSGKRKILQNT